MRIAVEYPRRGPTPKNTLGMTAYAGKIAELRQAGWSYGRIGKAIGRSRGAVAWQCVKHGVEKPGRPREIADTPGRVWNREGKTVRCFTEQEDRLLIELDAEGLNYSAMGRRLGRARSSVMARLMTLARRDERAEAA